MLVMLVHLSGECQTSEAFTLFSRPLVLMIQAAITCSQKIFSGRTAEIAVNSPCLCCRVVLGVHASS